MWATAVAHGAATIVNAIACGFGGAFGIDLYTKAKVSLDQRKGVRVLLHGLEEEDPSLARHCVGVVLEHVGVGDVGALVETWSNIPVGIGLKSSSAASNAIVLATATALDETLEGERLVRLGVEAARRAGVTITGAFDDAYASFFGGYALTNNHDLTVLKKGGIDEDLEVVVLIPEEKAYTKSLGRRIPLRDSKTVKLVHDLALKGYIWPALVLNSMVYCYLIGYDPKPGFLALEAGALAAGLTGTGPSFIAVVRGGRGEDVINAWKTLGGDVKVVGVNNEKALVVDSYR